MLMIYVSYFIYFIPTCRRDKERYYFFLFFLLIDMMSDEQIKTAEVQRGLLKEFLFSSLLLLY